MTPKQKARETKRYEKSESLIQEFAAEQHRIVEEVERRFSVIDELEAIVAANLKRAERSIVHRAFTGNLEAGSTAAN
jgi:hypothetical protein